MANNPFTPTSGVAYGSEFKDGNKAYITSPIAIATNAPLDARLQVPNFAALTAAGTWKLNSVGSGNQGLNTAYYGMITYVATDTDATKNGLYVLQSLTGNVEADKLQSSAWVKISKTKDEIDNLIATETYITIPALNDGNPLTIQAALQQILSLTPTIEGFEEINRQISGLENTVNGYTDSEGKPVDGLSARVANLESTLTTNVSYVVVEGTEKPADPKSGVIYIIDTATTATDNIREEWMYIEGNWEKIGTTAADLSNYYTKSDIDGKVQTINTAIDGKVAQGDFDTLNATVTAATTGLVDKVAALETKTADLDVADLKQDIADNTKAITDNKAAIEKTVKDLTDLVSDHSDDINAVYMVIDETITPDINQLKNDVSNKANTSALVDYVKNQQAEGVLTTDATTVIGAINEIDGAVDSLSGTVAGHTTALTTKVENTTKVNGYALSSDVTLYATDISVSSTDSQTVQAALNTKAAASDLSDLQAAVAKKVENTTTVNGKALSSNVTLAAADINTTAGTSVEDAIATKVENTTTVNGKALSSNVTLAAEDIKLSDGTTLQAAVTAKAEQSALDTLSGTVDGLSTSKADDSVVLKKANNLSDVADVATARTNLDVYAKGDVYTKSEIDNKFSSNLIYKVVTSLPTEGAQQNVIYLVAEEGATDVYVEYLYVANDEGGKFERIGTTKTDLSELGDLSTLTTDAKTTLVAAINEVDANANAAASAASAAQGTADQAVSAASAAQGTADQAASDITDLKANATGITASNWRTALSVYSSSEVDTKLAEKAEKDHDHDRITSGSAEFKLLGESKSVNIGTCAGFVFTSHKGDVITCENPMAENPTLIIEGINCITLSGSILTTSIPGSILFFGA